MKEKENTPITSFSILFLNDLLRNKVIDTGIYNKAVEKINTIEKEEQAA